MTLPGLVFNFWPSILDGILQVPNLLGFRFINMGFLPKNGSITRDDVKPWDIKKLTVGYQFCSEFEVSDIKGDFDNSETKCLHSGPQ